jgi:hypothetical protein
MSRPALEVADVFRQYAGAFRQTHGGSMSCGQLRVMHAVEVCRTAALGGHVDECDHCGQRTISYNSCGNRHCTKCQSLARARWLDDRRSELLPVEYFHVVFTVPDQIAQLALQNKPVVYNILFRAASETLRRIAADPRHLGAEIGFLAVLHTWGQNLHHHPHLHCVVPGGGLSDDDRCWVACPKRFLLPVKVLSRLFRRLFCDYLQEAFQSQKLKFHGRLSDLSDPQAFARWLQPLRQIKWNVYSKPPFGGPPQVLEYLGRYTHGVAISNNRILAIADGQVTFQWKDYKDGGTSKTMTLTADEFIRRFLLHVLPDRFVRIRHFGFLANRHRHKKLDLCRTLLNVTAATYLPTLPVDYKTCYQLLTGQSLDRCPLCHQGRMLRVEILAPVAAHIRIDSS